MSRNPMLVLGILGLVVLSGCGRGKQEAVLNMDEAILAIASARKAGADTYAKAPMRKAERLLADAQNKVKGREYRVAEAKAAKATESARTAESTAREAAYKLARKPSRTTARTTRTRRKGGTR